MSAIQSPGAGLGGEASAPVLTVVADGEPAAGLQELRARATHTNEAGRCAAAARAPNAASAARPSSATAMSAAAGRLPEPRCSSPSVRF